MSREMPIVDTSGFLLTDGHTAADGVPSREEEISDFIGLQNLHSGHDLCLGLEHD